MVWLKYYILSLQYSKYTPQTKTFLKVTNLCPKIDFFSWTDCSALF